MRAMHPPNTGRPKVLPWMVHLATNTNLIAKINLNESEQMIFFLPWFEPCFITRHEKPQNIYHRPLLHEDTNNGQYSEISILLTVLQLSGRPVAKCNQWNDRATQILPNTGPTGNPIISFAKVTVKSMSSQTMQTCWTCGYQTMHMFSNIFMSDHPKSVWNIQRIPLTEWSAGWSRILR